MRNRMIAGNWKMNKTFAEGIELARDLADELAGKELGKVDVVVCPPSVDLKGVAELIYQTQAPFSLGAQNCYWEESGAYTGEISVAMLQSVAAAYCIIGHSERREYFHETDADEHQKARALIAGGIVPIFCCGESEDIREAGTYIAHVTAQIRAGLAGLDIASAEQIVIAYEPIWAIGTGKTATADDAQEVCAAIRMTLTEIFDAEMAEGIRILYGGSAKPENIAELLVQQDVDGALVGGASLVAADFAEMVCCAAT